MNSKEKEIIEKIVHKKGPGPSTTYSMFHVFYAIELISKKTMGRSKIAKKIEVGEGVIDLDYQAPISEGRAAMGPGQVLLGNIDPVSVLRNSSPQPIREAIAECHGQAGGRYIAGAGCEVVRDTPHDNLRALCDYAHTH